ncbi:MAG: sulfate adenylyltransferase subunit CysN [Pirellulaceae bacterium]|nr:sulfate adenylyltransferase subunit CysN [Pirellulaceae bacterium]
MSHQSELISEDILAYLKQHEQKELLRFITCGSVDDGKSTLIGRLLFDSKMLYEDQLAQLESESKVHGTTGGKFDPALVTDGLKAEREQGITIDVAYRYFSTAKRKFIIADTPGHEQYTRNMATGASTADLAIMLIDARQGVLTQTKRHSFIVSLLGIRHIIVTVNKMDLVEFSEARFDEICDAYRDFASRLDLPDVHFIPISALNGDNVVDPSPSMPWYRGSTLMSFLESVYIGSDKNLEDLRFPVQFVSRPNLDFRGFCGTIASGIIRQGDEIMVLPSKRTSKVKRIVTYDGDLAEAFCSQAVSLVLEDEVDCSRGDMIVRPGNVPKINHQFDATIVWMATEPLIPGKTYLFKHTSLTTIGQIDSLRYRVDVNNLHRSPAPDLQLNEIGRCSVTVNQPFFYDAYRRNKTTGSFIMIDRISNITVAAGMITDRDVNKGTKVALWERVDDDVSQVASSINSVTEAERQSRYGQLPATVLLTGLTGTGKSTIAKAVERRLFDEGRAVAVIDGEQVRKGMNVDLSFSVEDRSENLRRSAHMAYLLNEQGLICIAAFVAPSESVRERVADVIGRDRFSVVHLTASLETRQQRDSKGFYQEAATGHLPEFANVLANYEPPENPDLVLDTGSVAITDCVDKIVELLRQKGSLKR